MRFLPHNKFHKKSSYALVILITASLSLAVFAHSYAQEESGGDSGVNATEANSADLKEIKAKIADRNSRIKALESEIAAYRTEASKISKEKQTLQNAIRSLDISKRQITTDIVLTENRISASELKIRELELEIELQRERIEQNKDALRESVKNLNEAESQTLVENLLAHEDLSEFWNQLERLERFRTGLRNSVSEISEIKDELEKNKVAIEANIQNLENLKGELASKRGAVEINREEKDELLERTASEEAKYQALIAEKEEQKQKFLSDLKNFEAQLNFGVTKEDIPPAGPGVLSWPLDSVRITQYFGNTAFATANSQVYRGRGHNGIDLAAGVGTPVKAALSGRVIGTGNTDAYAGCYSMGKWVLLEHPNGLSTLYMHLSNIAVSPGQNVTTGQFIGSSGQTGYTTGPHLHFGVYASKGIKIVNYGTVNAASNCAATNIPVADFNSYLNPLSFLQPL